MKTEHWLMLGVAAYWWFVIRPKQQMAKVNQIAQIGTQASQMLKF